MTTIDESQTAKGYTPAAQVPQVFGRRRSIDGIVIHHWGVTGQTHDGVVSFFTHGPGTTSAHYVVSAGRITCLVSPLDAAWHSGNAVGNATTIGIECRPEATPEDYDTVAELIRYLRARYGPLQLSPHREWQATACPGVWDLYRLDELAGSPINLASAIITHLQEAGVSLELKDLEAIQGIVQTERATIVNEIRANAEALAAALVRESYEDKVFTQAEIQTERATIVAEVRANAAATVNALKDNSDG